MRTREELTMRTVVRPPSMTKLVPAALVFALSLGSRARGQDAGDIDCNQASDFPCSFEIEALDLQKVPAVLKFQAQVSQAKLPRGEGRFGTIFVKLLRGVDEVCVEELHDVLVKDGVLNIEIGRAMDCELDEVVAENDDLSFQLCPGGVESCLQPVHLAATPYALKASFASVARRANRVALAGQASYAHRMTADRALFGRSTIGLGFFDFATPWAARASALFPDAEAFAPEARAGFLAWTPTRDPGAQHLHITGKQHGTERRVPLDSLRFESEQTLATGDLTVTPPADGAGLVVSARGAHITGDSEVHGTLGVTGGVAVAAEGVVITGDSDIAGELVVEARTTVAGGGIHVVGDSDIVGGLSVSQLLRVLSGGAQIVGPSDIQGTLLIRDPMLVTAGGLEVTGNSSVAAKLDVSGGLTVTQGGVGVGAGGLHVAAGGLAIAQGSLAVAGDARFVGHVLAQDVEIGGPVRAIDALGISHRFFALSGTTLGINPDASLDGTEFAGPVRFTGPVTFDGGTVDPAQAEAFVLASGENRDLVLGGSVGVAGALVLPAGIGGGLDAHGGVTVHGALMVPDGIDGDLTLGGALEVGAGASFTGPLTPLGGVAGGLAVSGAIEGASLAVAGGSTFGGAVTLAGGVSGPVTFSGLVTLPGIAGLLVAGPATLGEVTVRGPIQANGTARFDGSVTLAGGVSGNTSFLGDLAVSGMTVLAGPTSLGGGLIVDGATRLNGTVSFGSAFSGTTNFQSVAATGSLTIGGATTFSGPVSFPGGINGSVALGTVSVTSGLTVSGWTVVAGDVALNGAVTGLDGLSAYVRATGETRNLSLGGALTVAGNVSVQGTLSVPGGVDALEVGHLRVSNGVSIADDASFSELKIDGDLIVDGPFSAESCRVCFNYADQRGDDVAARKHACVRLADGEFSGLMALSGDVNNDDVFAVVYVCDDGASETATGWIF